MYSEDREFGLHAQVVPGDGVRRLVESSLFVHFTSQQLRPRPCHEVPEHVRKQAYVDKLSGTIQQGRAKMFRSCNWHTIFLIILWRMEYRYIYPVLSAGIFVRPTDRQIHVFITDKFHFFRFAS